jgi:hypothetical protein
LLLLVLLVLLVVVVLLLLLAVVVVLLVQPPLAQAAQAAGCHCPLQTSLQPQPLQQPQHCSCRGCLDATEEVDSTLQLHTAVLQGALPHVLVLLHTLLLLVAAACAGIVAWKWRLHLLLLLLPRSERAALKGAQQPDCMQCCKASLGLHYRAHLLLLLALSCRTPTALQPVSLAARPAPQLPH